MRADHHRRAEVRVPRPRRQVRSRAGEAEVTVADLMDRIRDEQIPLTAPGEEMFFPWERDLPEVDQPTVKIGHRAQSSRAHVGPWIAGALASATVLSTSLVLSHVTRPSTPSDAAAGTDSAVSNAGDHTRSTPAEPRIPSPRAAAPVENAPAQDTPGPASPRGGASGGDRPNDVFADGASPDHASRDDSPDHAFPDGSAPRHDGGAHRAPESGDDSGPGRGSRRGRGRDPESDGGGSGGGRDVTASGGSVRCDTPGHILNLANWKLTLPTGSGSRPTEVLGSALGSLTGQSNNWFSVGRGCGVTFRAPVNGVTTSGSKNPRSELREMSDGGSENAGWSSTSGTHTMVLKEAFTKLPSGKPQVVGGQIHDASDDISVFRLEGSNLYVTDGNNPHYQLVTSNYVLGTPFEAKYVVSGGVIRAYYNGRLAATLNRDFSGAYFKAGAYTQANCQDASPCSSGNYGEVTVYSLRVTHT